MYVEPSAREQEDAPDGAVAVAEVGVDLVPPTPTSELEPRRGFVADVADEVRWTCSDRRAWIGQVLLNLLIGLPVVIYNQWNDHLADRIEITGFATSIAAWVLASTLNTNQFGYDADRVRRSLEAGDSAARIMVLKNVAVCLVMLPAIFGISIVLRVMITAPHDSIPLALLRDLAVMTTWLGFGSVLSVLLPFRPLGLRRRWRSRATWLRFGVAVLAPYAVYYGLAKAWRQVEERALDDVFGRPGHDRYLSALVVLGWGVFTWLIGLAFAEGYTRTFRSRIVAHLGVDRSDPGHPPPPEASHIVPPQSEMGGSGRPHTEDHAGGATGNAGRRRRKRLPHGGAA